MELPILNKVIHVKIPKKCNGISKLSPLVTPIKDDLNQSPLHVSNSSPSLFSMKDLELKQNDQESDNQINTDSNHAITNRRPMSPPTHVYLSSPHEINYFQCFFPLLQDIQFIWELVVTCEPIIVMAPTPDVTCEVVQALVNCIYPLKYVPDFRPFFTIHDSEFKEYTATSTAP